MVFSLKAYKAAQKARQVKKSPTLTSQATAAPTVAAGKGRGPSSKSKMTINPKVKSAGATKPKAAKVTAAKLNSGPNNKFSRSTRVNYRKLRSPGK